MKEERKREGGKKGEWERGSEGVEVRERGRDKGNDGRREGEKESKRA